MELNELGFPSKSKKMSYYNFSPTHPITSPIHREFPAVRLKPVTLSKLLKAYLRYKSNIS